VPDEDLVPAAIDRRPGLDHHETVATGWLRVLLHREAADNSPAVQALVVVPQLVAVILLFLGEVALDQQLAGEVVIAGERAQRALGALGRSDFFLWMVHRWTPPVRMPPSIQDRRGSYPGLSADGQRRPP
jgi:hypothetical protein